MTEERPKFEQALRNVCDREGYSVRRIPEVHAGGKWLVRYGTASGQGGKLQIDINYLFRQPLWPPMVKDSLISGVEQTRRIPVLDVHELAAGKLAALFSRHASRDLFDSHHSFTHYKLRQDRLRVTFLVYGAINRKDWRKISVADVKYNQADLQRELLPLLRTSATPDSWNLWVENMVVEPQSRLEALLPFSKREMEFKELIEKIRRHPGLEWKALNVLRRKGNK